MVEQRCSGIVDHTEDPEARMGVTLDIEMRFQIETSSARVKDMVAQMGSASYAWYMRHASKFVSAAGSTIQ